MNLSTVLPLILTVLTLILVLMSPALQGVGALTPPLKQARRSLINAVVAWVLTHLVRLFGKPVTTPPALVVRAIHRGENLVVLQGNCVRRRLEWSA